MNLDTERRTHIADMEIVKQIENLCGGPQFVLTRHDAVIAVMEPIDIQRVRVEFRDSIDQFSYED
jgi:hypothetical protein